LYEKLKRFDDVFRMLLVVMTISMSIGLSTYSGFNLWLTLLYFVLSITFWTFAHLLGSNPLHTDLEICVKIYAWTLALLVTMSALAKSALKVSVLDFATKIPIAIVTLVFTIMAYHWLGELIPPDVRRRYMIITFNANSFLVWLAL